MGQVRRVAGLLRSALDWRHVSGGMDEAGVVAEVEARLAGIVAVVRVSTVPFLLIPLFSWERLTRPWLMVLVVMAAGVEAAWFWQRATRRRRPPGGGRTGVRGDGWLAAVDAVTCMVIMVVGSRAGSPALRNTLLTELVPFSLVSPVVVAFAVGLRPVAVAAVGALAVTWTVAVLPDVTPKLGSDVLGFIVWYLAGLAVATLMRGMAMRTAAAVQRMREAEQQTAEQRRLLDLALQSEKLRRNVHDGVLPILDGLALDTRLTPQARRAARQGGLRARALMQDNQLTHSDFAARVIELAQTFLDLGLLLNPRVYVHEDPPARVADVLLDAAGEALANAMKYAGPDAEVVLFVESGADGAEISVLDGGPGFDMATSPRGEGYRSTLRAVESIGGRCAVLTSPGAGTRVTLTWQPRDGG